MGNNILNRKFSYSFSNVTLILIGINFIVFCLTYFLFPRLEYYLALVPSFVLYKHYYWQFLTYMFTHASMSHLFFNMLSLYIFGTECERRIGSKEFLLFYLLIGFLSGVASYFSFYLSNTNTVLLGASGAVYGIMLLFSVLYPRARVYVFGLLPISAPVLVIVSFILEFLSQWRMDGIAHMTHLFGIFFAFLYIIIRMRMNPLREWRR